MLVGKFDQACGLPHRLLANAVDANFADDFQSGTRGFQCRDMCSPVHEAERRLSVADFSWLERKRILMGKPAGEFGLKFLTQIVANIQVSNARPSTEPFQNAAAGEVDVKLLNIDGHGAKRLKDVKNNHRSDVMGLLNDCLCVLGKS